MAASPNLIQIKRSQTTGTPASLANGELAFTAAGNVVFIGNYGSVLPIAGQRTPGTLTANQALVANSTGYIDQVKTANLYTTTITANGTTGTDGSVLAVNSSGQLFWSTTAAVGPSYIQNTDSRTLSGNLYFTAANTTIENLNVTTINRSPKLTLSGDVSGNVTFTNLGDAVLNVTVNNANGVTLGVDTEGDYVADIYAGNGIVSFTGTGEGSTPTIIVKAADGIVANTTGLFANVDNSTLELSSGAIRVKDNGIALGTKTTGDYVQNITAGNGVSVSVTSGESAQPVIAAVVGSGLKANTTGIHIDPAAAQTFESIQVNATSTLNGNVVLGSSSQDNTTLNGTLVGSLLPTTTNTYDVGGIGAVYNKGYFTQLQLGSSSDSTITASANTITVYGLTVNSNFIANTGTVYHDFYIGGSLYITGNAVYSNVESYVVTDPLIQLAANNTDTDLLDIGFFGNYNTGGGAHEHTGLFRDASDGKLIKNIKKGDKVWKELEKRYLDTATKNAMKTGFKMNENKPSVTEKSDDVFADYSSSKGKTKGRSFSVNRAMKDGKYSFESDDNDGTVRLLYNGKLISYGYPDWSTGGFIMIHSSWKNNDKPFNSLEDIIKYFKSKRITTEADVVPVD